MNIGKIGIFFLLFTVTVWSDNILEVPKELVEDAPSSFSLGNLFGNSQIPNPSAGLLKEL